MAYKILNNVCICCGTCESVCRTSAISVAEDGYVIDPNKCTECTEWSEVQKCVEACPVGAPVPDRESAV